jgi:hypothetical protein
LTRIPLGDLEKVLTEHIPRKNGETIVRLNALLNDLMAKEVGTNDGKFLPDGVRPEKPPMTFGGP